LNLSYKMKIVVSEKILFQYINSGKQLNHKLNLLGTYAIDEINMVASAHIGSGQSSIAIDAEPPL
jgi:hypothetical protein